MYRQFFCARLILYLLLAVVALSLLNLVKFSSANAQDDRGLRRNTTESPSVSPERIALVIGNQNYEEALEQSQLNDGDIVPDTLKNPLNDAKEIFDVLKNDLDFDATLLPDANIDQMRIAIRAFGDKLRQNNGSTALLFYSGHAVQVNGENYLIPLGVAFGEESEVDRKAIGLRTIFDEMGNRETGVNLIILDSCRDNPFKSRSIGTQSGLAAPSFTPNGTFIAYAAKAGKKAKDGPRDGHSPFTKALLRIIKSCEAKGLPLTLLFGKVSDEVMRMTSGNQTPSIYSEVGNYILIPPSQSTPVSTPSCTNTIDNHRVHCMPDSQNGILVEVPPNEQIKVIIQFDANNENCIQIYRQRDGQIVAVWNNFEEGSKEWKSERNSSCNIENYLIVSRHKDSGPDATRPWFISAARIISGDRARGSIKAGFEDGGDTDFNDAEVTIKWIRES